jgi:hypothetical protein
VLRSALAQHSLRPQRQTVAGVTYLLQIPKETQMMKDLLRVEELEERIAPSSAGNPHDAPPGQGNWGGGPGNSGEGDQNSNTEQGGGGQPKDKP